MKRIYLMALLILPLLTFSQKLVPIKEEKKPEVKGLKMYPNPAYGEEVYITTATNGKENIKIYDIFNEVVLAENLNTNTLNISRLSAGVYAIEVTENNNATRRKLVVK